MSQRGTSIKKDSTVKREVERDIEAETEQTQPRPKYANPNRDQARGDWDRSGMHTDEERSRE